MHENNPHRRRRHVQLPGGRHIEVVYLDGGREGDGPSAARPAHPVDGPHTPAQASRASSDIRARAASPRAGNAPATAPGEALHVCPRCDGELVSPLDWSEESPGRWRILLRCPDCDLLREDVFGQALVERFDEELDRATASLLGDLKQLTHANMVEEIERFTRALELDLIGPSDF